MARPAYHKDGDLIRTLTITDGATELQSAGYDLTSGASQGSHALSHLSIYTKFTLSAGTVAFDLIESANSDLSSPTVIYSYAAISASGELEIAIPSNLSGRYVGIQVTGAGGAAGTIDELILDVPTGVQG